MHVTQKNLGNDLAASAQPAPAPAVPGLEAHLTAVSTTQKPGEQPPGEVRGPPGLEPTRYGDWDINGRCSDF